jgi:hypothetical protein
MTDAYPLQWPVGRERTGFSARRYGNLNKMPGGRIRQLLSRELRLMDVGAWVISSNLTVRQDGLPYAGQKVPEDPGVVLYFTRKNVDIAISCDAWHTVDANLRAIGLTIEAIRGTERWGTEEMIDRAFTGFKALPESIILGEHTARAWWEVLQVSPEAEKRIIGQDDDPGEPNGPDERMDEYDKGWYNGRNQLRASQRAALNQKKDI